MKKNKICKWCKGELKGEGYIHPMSCLIAEYESKLMLEFMKQFLEEHGKKKKK